MIGLAVIAFIDLGNEHYETRKLRQEIVDNAQRIEDEAVREVYIQEANAACDFRWQFAFAEFIPNLLSEPVDIVFFPFGIDTNPVNYMRGPVYNLYSSDYVWDDLQTKTNISDEEILNLRKEIRDNYVFG